MNDFPAHLAKLYAQTQESRYQFLRVGLLTSFTAIDFGNTELKIGNREWAESEVRCANRGYDTILRFLPGLDSQHQREKIQTTLARLRECIDALRNKLGLPK